MARLRRDGENGWFAHLDTQHAGNLRSGGFRTFADWSKRRVALDAASHDRAPGKSPARFRR